MLRRVKGFIYATPTLERDPQHTTSTGGEGDGGGSERNDDQDGASEGRAGRYWECAVHDVRAYPVYVHHWYSAGTCPGSPRSPPRAPKHYRIPCWDNT
jgi:hypothetical protein